MAVLVGGLLILMLAFLLHVVVWHAALPTRHTRALLLIAVCAFTSSLALRLFTPHSHVWTSLSFPGTVAEWLETGLFVAAVTLAYVVTYSAVEEDSPSMRIVKWVAQESAIGVEPATLEAVFATDDVLLARIDNLIRDGLLRRDGELLALTTKGERLTKLFAFYRALLRLQTKGG